MGHTTDLAKLHQVTQALAVLEAALSRAHQLRGASETAFQRVREEIAGAMRVMTPTLPRDMPLPQLEAWLTRRGNALEVRASILAAERDLREADADAKAARKRLTTTLVAAGVAYEADASVEMLLAAAQAAIDREAELKGSRGRGRGSSARPEEPRARCGESHRC